MQCFTTRVFASILALALSCSSVAAETTPVIADPADKVAEAIDRLGYDSPADTQSVQQLLNYLDSEDAQHRWRAARALGVMEYEPAADRLVELLEDSDPVVQIHAIIALGRIGDKSPETIEAILDEVDSSDPRVARTALLALSELKPGPDKLAEAIEAALQSEDSAVMTHVLEALVEAGPRANPLLIKALAKEKSAYWAALAIAEIGPGSAPTVPALVELLKNCDDPGTLQQALLAVAAIGPEASAASEVVQEIANDTDEPGATKAACYALGMLGDPSATDLLKRLESEGDDFQTMVAAWSIAKVNPDATDAQQHAVELLTEGLESENPELREAAAVGLSELGAPSEVVAPALLAALEGASEEQRSNIAEALADLGKPVLKKAIPALEKPEFRDIAIEVIGRLGPDAAEAVGPLTAQLANATDEQKARINFALASIGEAASASSADIAAGLQSDDPAVRQSAMFALREFGVKGRGGVRPLAQFFLETNDGFEKLAAAWTLAAMKPTGPIAPLAAALEAGLSNPNSAARLETLRAIADLGPAAQPLAARVMEVSVSDEDPDVREAAEELAAQLKN